MKQQIQILLIASSVLFLSACGGNDEAELTAMPESAAAPEKAEKAYNPLESQQQLIKDAEAIQGFLDKDAEEKKKALGEIN